MPRHPERIAAAIDRRPSMVAEAGGATHRRAITDIVGFEIRSLLRQPLKHIRWALAQADRAHHEHVVLMALCEIDGPFGILVHRDAVRAKRLRKRADHPGNVVIDVAGVMVREHGDAERAEFGATRRGQRHSPSDRVVLRRSGYDVQ